MSAFILVFGDSRPVDVVLVAVEFIVLFLLLGELIAKIRHRRSVAKQLTKLFYAFADGQELQATAPDLTDQDSASSGKWKHAVHHWIDVTRKILEGCSGNAVISFMHNPDFRVAGAGRKGAGSEYETLIARMNNLRCIMEHMDAYVPR